MGYKCVLGGDKDCDGCYRCHQNRKAMYCAECEAELGEGERYYDIDGTILCEECAQDWLWEKYGHLV